MSKSRTEHWQDAELGGGENAHETLSYVMDIICEGVWDWNANTGHVSRSPGWYRMLGYEIGCFEESVMTWENVIHPDDYPAVMAHFEAYTSGQCDRYEIEYRCRMADGGYKWIRDQGRIVARNGDGSVARMIGAHLDIHDQRRAQAELERQNRILLQDNVSLESLIQERTAELEQLNEQLNQRVREVSYLATTDKLTQLHNRYSFESELEREIARARRYGSPMGITLFDIDYFKEINDSFGHGEGDTALTRVSETVRQCIRQSDIAARWGGDEFVIIFPEADLDHTYTSTEKLMSQIMAIQFERFGGLSGSFGITGLLESDNRDTLMRRVDDALYEAKQKGRGMICVR